MGIISTFDNCSVVIFKFSISQRLDLVLPYFLLLICFPFFKNITQVKNFIVIVLELYNDNSSTSVQTTINSTILKSYTLLSPLKSVGLEEDNSL